MMATPASQGLRRWRVLLLPAVIVLFAVLSVMSYGVRPLLVHLFTVNPLAVGIGFFFIHGWLNWIALLGVYGAVIWAGCVMPSRRPSRRKAAFAILALAALLTLIGLRVGHINMPGFSLAVWLQTLFSLLSYGGGLFWLWRTRGDAAVQPRLALPSMAAEPADRHPVVAPAIRDGDAWHADLLKSLADTDQQQTPKISRWPLILALIGIVAGGQILSLIVSAVFAKAGPDVNLMVSYIQTALLLVIIAVPAAMVRRRLMGARQKRAEDSLLKSDKRPIFYLRSFGLDEAIGQPSILELFFNVTQNNAEQVMVHQVAKCGPVIAIGRPGEHLPSLGAARFYVSDARWQEKVADVAAVARMVVWASGTTPGLQWEISHLVRELPPEKLVLWAHPHLLDLDTAEREAEWSVFVDGLGQLFPKPLPKPLGKTRYFAFDPDFTPIPYADKPFRPALRQILADRRIPPYDPEGEQQAAKRRRIVLGAGAAVAGVVALLIGVFVVGSLLPTQPKPELWNSLAYDLINDEFTQGAGWWNSGVQPKSSDEVGTALADTVGQLHGRLFARNWENLTPGQLGRMRTAAEAYKAIYDQAHLRGDVENMIYGRASLFDHVTTADEAQQRIGDLKALRDVLKKADGEWAKVMAASPGYPQPAKLHDIITARQSLLEAEVAVLTMMSEHPGEWYAGRGQNNEPMIYCTQDDNSFCAMAKGSDAARSSAYDALQGVQTRALADSSASSSQ